MVTWPWTNTWPWNNTVISPLTYRNNFDIQLTVSDWSSDCTCFWWSTCNMDIYWAKQCAIRVMLAHSSVQPHWLIAVPVSTAGLTTCKSLCMSIVLFKASLEKHNMLETGSIAVSNEESPMPCVLWSWTDSSWPSFVVLVTRCMHCSMKSALAGNWCLKTQLKTITAEYNIITDYISQYKWNKSGARRTYM